MGKSYIYIIGKSHRRPVLYRRSAVRSTTSAIVGDDLIKYVSSKRLPVELQQTSAADK
jgi:hypothetical protein